MLPQQNGHGRKHDREHIDREADRGENHSRLGGLSKRRGKARIHGQADRGETERRRE
jgi:hypothetical protein